LAATIPLAGDALKGAKILDKSFTKFEKAFTSIEKAGDPQWTRGAYGAEHAARSENMVRDTVKAGGLKNVEKIFYNKSISTILPGADINKLPDAVVKWKGGRFTLIEVASPSQTATSQREKLREMARALQARTGKKVDFRLDQEIAKRNSGNGKSGGGGKSCGNWVGGC
jgi:hypothetical protein